MRTVTTAQVAPTTRRRASCPSGCRRRPASSPAGEGGTAGPVGRVGLGVLHELMASEVEELVGPKGRHDRGRSAKRHGHEDGSVTLGGRRVAVSRPRVRSADDEREVALETYRHFADRDPLTELVFEQMLAGVSTRRFARTREPVGREVEATRSLRAGRPFASAVRSSASAC